MHIYVMCIDFSCKYSTVDIKVPQNPQIALFFTLCSIVFVFYNSFALVKYGI